MWDTRNGNIELGMHIPNLSYIINFIVIEGFYFLLGVIKENEKQFHVVKGFDLKDVMF